LFLFRIHQVKNSGNTDWPTGTKLVFVSGNREFCADNRFEVAPAKSGEVVDVNAVLTTASQPQRQVAYFRLTDPEKGYFGPKFWVDVFAGADPSTAASPMDVDDNKSAASAVPAPKATGGLNPATPAPGVSALVEKYALQLQLLQSFGCSNTELNIALLEKHHGDLKKAYAELTGLSDD